MFRWRFQAWFMANKHVNSDIRAPTLRVRLTHTITPPIMSFRELQRTTIHKWTTIMLRFRSFLHRNYRSGFASFIAYILARKSVIFYFKAIYVRCNHRDCVSDSLVRENAPGGPFSWKVFSRSTPHPPQTSCVPRRP